MFKCEYKVESDVLWVWESAFRLAHIQTYVYENAIPLAAWCAFDFQLQFYKIDSPESKTPCRTCARPHRFTIWHCHSSTAQRRRWASLKDRGMAGLLAKCTFTVLIRFFSGWSLFWMHSFCEGRRQLQISNMFIHLRWEAYLNRTQYVIN